jgi:hypothetical protein
MTQEEGPLYRKSINARAIQPLDDCQFGPACGVGWAKEAARIRLRAFLVE